MGRGFFGLIGHRVLNCTPHSAFRVDLQSVKLILMKDSLQDLLSSIKCDHARLQQILLFGHPMLKLKPISNIYRVVSKYLERTNRFTSP